MARIQGVLAKPRIVEMAYGTGEGSEAPDLEAYQRGSWLGSTIGRHEEPRREPGLFLV
jgi:hypothetical protein